MLTLLSVCETLIVTSLVY